MGASSARAIIRDSTILPMITVFLMALGDTRKDAGAYDGTLDKGNTALIMCGPCHVLPFQRLFTQIY